MCLVPEKKSAREKKSELLECEAETERPSKKVTTPGHVAVVAACCADLKQAKDVAVGGPSLRYRLSVRAFLGRARSSAADPRSAPRMRVRKIGARRPSRGASTCRVQFQAKYAEKTIR